MTDTITELDALAIACIERPNDFAAWASLCDYCEEHDLRYHPRALAWVLNARISNSGTKQAVDEQTKSLAYGRFWNHNDSAEVYTFRFIWALPLFRKVTT